MTPEETASMIMRQAFREAKWKRCTKSEGVYTSLVVGSISDFERASIQLASSDAAKTPARMDTLHRASALSAIDAAAKALLAAIYHPHTELLVVDDGAEIMH